MKVGIGLIGYGNIGKVHAHGYRSISSYYNIGYHDIDLIGVCTAHDNTGQQAIRSHNFQYCCTDYRKLLEDKNINVIDCSIPNRMHYQIVIDAIEAGKHVYCEKPLAMNTKEAECMLEKATASEVKCQIAFNYRFIPAISRAKQLIGEGRLGKVLNFRCFYLHSGYLDLKRPISWRLNKSISGGGALVDLGSHCLDLIRHLIADTISVFASMYTIVKSRPDQNGSSHMVSVDVDDVSYLQLTLANGAIGTVEASRLSTGSVDELRLEIQGEKGAVRFNLMDPNWLYFYDNNPKSEPFGGDRGFKRIETLQRYPDTELKACSRTSVGWQRFHMESQYSFIRSIIYDLDPVPSFKDGFEVQRILEAAYKSAEKKKWIVLSRDL